MSKRETNASRVKRRDARKPASVTVKGLYTVRIYDEELYRQSIEQYYQEETREPGTHKKTQTASRYTPFPKHPTYGWTDRPGPQEQALAGQGTRSSRPGEQE